MSDKERESESFEGEEELLGGLPPSRDPYTPEPGPRPGEQRAFRIMRWAWVPLLIVAVLILIAVLREEGPAVAGPSSQETPPASGD